MKEGSTSFPENTPEYNGQQLYSALSSGNEEEILKIIKYAQDISDVPGVGKNPADILGLIKDPWNIIILNAVTKEYYITTDDALLWAARYGNYRLFGSILLNLRPFSYRTLCNVVDIITDPSREGLRDYVRLILNHDESAIFKYSSKLNTLIQEYYTQFVQIKRLLEEGYRPITGFSMPSCYYYDNIDPTDYYVNDIIKGNLNLLKLLFEYDIKPNDRNLRIFLKSAKAKSALNDNILSFLITNLLPEWLVVFKDKIRKIFNEMFTLISSLKQEADAQGKPLLLLLGENHHSRMSGLLETIIITLANQYFNLTSVMTENTLPVDVLSAEQLLLIPHYKKRVFPDDTSDRIIVLLCEKLKIKLNRIDFYSATYRLGMHPGLPNSLSKAGIEIRNSGMAEKAIAKSHEGDAVFITGANHLQGLVQETNLHSAFYVKAFNLAPSISKYLYGKFIPRNSYERFKISPCVYQTCELLKGFEVYASPSMIVDSVREICQQEIDNIKKPLTASSSSSSSVASCSTDVAPTLQFSSIVPKESIPIKELIDDVPTTSKRNQPEVRRCTASEERCKRFRGR
ncbi:MAG: hypothetical protein HYX61_04525 [Gammaproteobacteria bacterium]|jgi:hypothetical protein|nr:hypothetical protein [Gammaproteobacteria bacterium]